MLLAAGQHQLMKAPLVAGRHQLGELPQPSRSCWRQGGISCACRVAAHPVYSERAHPGQPHSLAMATPAPDRYLSTLSSFNTHHVLSLCQQMPDKVFVLVLPEQVLVLPSGSWATKVSLRLSSLPFKLDPSDAPLHVPPSLHCSWRPRRWRRDLHRRRWQKWGRR